MSYHPPLKGYLGAALLGAFLPLQAAHAATWTILVYGHGDHNLTPSLITDMQEMMAVGSSDTFNIVVQADFDAQNDPSMAGGFRYLLQAGAEEPVPVQTLPEPDMDDPAVLADFLRWGIQTYPAQRYGLVLWDHGGQWQGFGPDSQDGTREGGGILTQPISNTLAQVRSQLNLGKFDFITFDTCLMAGAEVLGDFTAHTDLYIANAELDYGAGWDYTATLGWLKANSDAPMAEFAVQESAQWQAHHQSQETDKALQAHAAFDLTQYDAFQTALFQFFTELNRVFPNDQNTIVRLRRQVTQYDVDSMEKLKDPTDYIDLGEFASKLAAASSDAAFQQSAQNLIAAINAMTLAKVLGTTRQQAGAYGLSIYYPVSGAQAEAYATLNFSQAAGQNPQNWISFLNAVAGAKQQDSGAPSLADVQPPANLNPTPANPTVVNVPISEADAVALSASLISKRVEADKQVVFSNGQVVLPEVIVPNRVTGQDDSYQVTLALNPATGHFHAQLAPVSENIPETVMSSTFKWETMTLHVPVVYVDTPAGRKGYQVDLQVKSVSPLELGVTALRPAEQVFYLYELAYDPISGPGTYTVSWDGKLPVLSADNGQTFSYLSGFRLTPGSDVVSSMALYAASPTSSDIQFVLLQTQPSTGKVLGALDGETANTGAAPRGVELKPGGVLLPMYYGEVRTDQDPEQWDAELFSWGKLIQIPAGGVTALGLTTLEISQADYILEVSAEDAFGNTSQPREFALDMQP